MEPLVILLAFLAGLAFKRLGYPALPGYLLAGFIAHGLNLGEVAIIEAIADIGLTLLLFTIGLKLNIRDITAPQIWGVAALQVGIVVPLTTLVIVISGIIFPILALENTASAWILAFALSFSSTVFAVKIFEERGESASFHARIAIGILVLQDIMAVGFIVLTADQQPTWWALSLFLLVFARPLLLWLLRMAQHGELVLLFGFMVALGAGQLFEAFYLKAGLGALVAGLLLSNATQTKELYNNLMDLKDLFLIGFFLQIGYYGLPTEHMWFVAAALSLLIFLRPMIYYLLFVGFSLRARTSLLASSSLFSYSEFGLVVTTFAMLNLGLPSEWLTTIALAVSISFFIATPLNARIHTLYGQYGHLLQRIERGNRIAAETPADLGDVEIVVMGMGRVGQGAYEYLRETYGDKIVGVEESFPKVMSHRAEGFNCVHGDASDHDFWAHSGVKNKKLVLISLTNHNENLIAVELAKQTGFTGKLAVVSRFPDQQAELEALGCISFNLYGEAGHGFAEHVVEQAGLTSL